MLIDVLALATTALTVLFPFLFVFFCSWLLGKFLIRRFELRKWMAYGIASIFPVVLLCVGFLAYMKLVPRMFGEDPKTFWAIDGCLDGGGCWDYVDSICRKEEPNANELCARKK